MFDPTKRHTLEILLAALSVALVKPQNLELWKPLLSPTTEIPTANPEIMQGLQSLIDACWQLSRGNELALAEKLLPECMARLVPLAQQPSPYQQEAINLTAQGFRLHSIFALHRNDLPSREMYCKQAVHYSLLSGNQNLLIASLKGLADTYYYGRNYPQALQTYLSALPRMKDISPLLQARVYMGLAVAHAHIDQGQDAFTYLGLALNAYPNHPEADSCFSYADFDRSQMFLWESIARTQLGQTQQALDVLSQIEQHIVTMPERIRIEIINQRAKTAMLAGDLEQGVTHVKTGLLGAKALGSQRCYNEAYENFQQMRLLWPQEKRVTELGELLH